MLSQPGLEASIVTDPILGSRKVSRAADQEVIGLSGAGLENQLPPAEACSGRTRGRSAPSQNLQSAGGCLRKAESAICVGVYFEVRSAKLKKSARFRRQFQSEPSIGNGLAGRLPLTFDPRPRFQLSGARVQQLLGRDLGVTLRASDRDN